MVKHGKRDASRELAKIPQYLEMQIKWMPIHLIKVAPYNARKHPEAQILALMQSLTTFGWTFPIIADESGRIICGHGRLEAARRVGCMQVPVLTRSGLSELDKQALAIADNQIASLATWDMEILSEDLKVLLAADYNIEVTGFVMADIDVLIDGVDKEHRLDPADAIAPGIVPKISVSRPGDLWILGNNRLLCGDARSPVCFYCLMQGQRAQMVVTDPPYNVKIWGHARGRGRIKHRDFAMASGEMSPAQFRDFLAPTMHNTIGASDNGSIHYWFMDWRHLPVLLAAANPLYTEWKQLLVWNKTNGGQGAFYRSKHELIGVFKNGDAPHINNFGLGAKGRHRTNVLDYPGISSAATREEMDLHPTVKPIALIADLMRDCSKRGGIVLDPFAGSGTVFLAAERSGRRAFGMEIDPVYVDVAVERWQRLTGKQAIHAETSKTFAQMRETRASSRARASLPAPVAGDVP